MNKVLSTLYFCLVFSKKKHITAIACRSVPSLNFDFSFLSHPNDTRDKPAVLRTNSFCLRQNRKTSFIRPTKTKQTKLKFRITKDKRFHFVSRKFFINRGVPNPSDNLSASPRINLLILQSFQSIQKYMSKDYFPD